MRHEHHRGKGRPEGPENMRRGGGRGRGGARLLSYGELRLLVLSLIAEQPRHGYELIKAISALYGGGYEPSPGVIYPTLAWLEDMGLIRIKAAEGGRKLSRILPEGMAFLQANHAAIEELRRREPPQGRPHDVPEAISTAMESLKGALRSRFGRRRPSQQEIDAIAETIQKAANAIAGVAGGDTAGTPHRNNDSRELRGLDRHDKEREQMDEVIRRHRHETRRRSLVVEQVSRLTPHMIRIILAGDDLSDFVSLSPDDHIKLFVGGEKGGKPEMRDYTPRAFDTTERKLTLDFAVHDAGPATAWALAATPGDTLQIGGPRGSAVIAPVFDWYLLIGDETALPAIGRRIEELPEGVQVISLVGVPGTADEQSFTTAARHEAHWVHRDVAQADDPTPMLAALETLSLPEGKGFIWIAAEAGVARALRDHVEVTRGHPRHWMKASGYWTRGKADGADKSLD